MVCLDVAHLCVRTRHNKSIASTQQDNMHCTTSSTVVQDVLLGIVWQRRMTIMSPSPIDNPCRSKWDSVPRSFVNLRNFNIYFANDVSHFRCRARFATLDGKDPLKSSDLIDRASARLLNKNCCASCRNIKTTRVTQECSKKAVFKIPISRTDLVFCSALRLCCRIISDPMVDGVVLRSESAAATACRFCGIGQRKQNLRVHLTPVMKSVSVRPMRTGRS